MLRSRVATIHMYAEVSYMKSSVSEVIAVLNILKVSTIIHKVIL